jgi:ABC-type nitrate/sulfonate/bicarbonate transport system substrate-binding protein
MAMANQSGQITRGRRGTKHRAGVAFGAVGIAAALALTACSSSSSSSGSSSGSAANSSSSPVSLTVGIPNPGTQNDDYYLALEGNVFSRLGLNVNTVTEGATETTALSTGTMVVGNFGTTGMFSAVASGRHMQVVYSENTGASTGAIFVKASSPYKTIMSLSGQKAGSIGTNGQGYGAVASYSHYISTHGGKPLDIVVEANPNGLLAALESGQIAAAMNNVTGAFAAAVEQGKLRQITSPTDPMVEQILGGKNVAAASFFGLSSALASNKTAITRFVAGLRVARMQTEKASVAQIAAVMAKNPSFAPSVVSAQALQSGLTAQRPFDGTADGYVSPDLWSNSLKAFSNWGLNLNGTSLDLTQPGFSYANAIDMSYWNAATPLVNSYVKKYGVSLPAAG